MVTLYAVCSGDALAELTGRLLRVVRLADCADDADAVRPCLEHFVHVVHGDAADGNDWDGGDGLFDMAEGLDAGGSGVGLGAGGEHGADCDVIDPLGGGLFRLLEEGVGGAHELPGMEDTAGLGGGQVVLAEVEAVGVTCYGQVGVVVGNEDGVVSLAEGQQPAGDGELVTLAVELVSKLDGGGSAAEGRLRHVHNISPAGGLRVDDDVEAGNPLGVGGTDLSRGGHIRRVSALKRVDLLGHFTLTSLIDGLADGIGEVHAPLLEGVLHVPADVPGVSIVVHT